MTNVAWLLRPARLRAAATMLAALAIAAVSAVPASAQAGQAGTAPAATRAGEWWLTALNVAGAWHAAPAEGSGVTVAVLSTGVAGDHPDLTGIVTTGPDLSQTGRLPGDQYWGAEGTAVASLIAGHGHGPGLTDGITGVAPRARILSIPVTLEYDDPLNFDAAIARRLPAAIAAGIRYAVDHGAAVIALPLDPGTLGSALSGDPAAAAGNPAERAAVRYALAHDVVLVAPAGDNGASLPTVSYPTAYPGVVAVGATARDGQLSPFMNPGSAVALTAPGSGALPLAPGAGDAAGDPASGLPVAAPGGGYQSLASTDMSAALTAGVAALIRGRYPQLTVAEVTRALEQGATFPAAAGPAPAGASGVKPGWGHGALGAAGALTAAGAIAAAQPAGATPGPAGTPTPPKAARAAGPAGAGSARPGAGHRAGMGTQIRSILLYLVVAAGALIAALAAALAIARVRRRPSARRPGQSARTTPPRPARHARTPPGPAGGRHAPAAARIPANSREAASGPVTAALRPPAPLSAAPLSAAPLPAAPLPAAQPTAGPARRAEPGLAPWERSPADFAAAPVAREEPPRRPPSNSGPMYIWNPPDPPDPPDPAD